MKTAIQLFGEDIPFFGRNLPLQISTAMLSERNNFSLSFAINVKLVENMKTQEAKLIIHSRESIRENTTAFTGTLIKSESSTLCVGYCQHSPLECWIIETV